MIAGEPALPADELLFAFVAVAAPLIPGLALARPATAFPASLVRPDWPVATVCRFMLSGFMLSGLAARLSGVAATAGNGRNGGLR